MESFDIFFERRVRNPLRKKALEGTPTNKDWIEQTKEDLPAEELEKIRKMEEFNVEPERIEAFKKGKIAEYQKKLESKYFRPKLEEPILIFNNRGIKVFIDKFATKDFTKNSPYVKAIRNLTNQFLVDYKDVLPNRKPKIVITETDRNPNTKDIKGKGISPIGAYRSRIIYMDENYLNNYNLFIHEYAHFLSDRIPRQAEPFLRKEYKKMLNEYFGKNTKRKDLEGEKNEKHRKAMAMKLGLPSEYAATNFDEWFAEIITNWKKLPKDVSGYKFKQIMKKILVRL